MALNRLAAPSFSVDRSYRYVYSLNIKDTCYRRAARFNRKGHKEIMFRGGLGLSLATSHLKTKSHSE